MAQRDIHRRRTSSRRRAGAWRSVAWAILVVLGIGCWGCAAHGPCPSRGPCVRLAGSSTVYPLSVLVAEAFEQQHAGVHVAVASGGSAAGFRGLCAGDIDIANASRPISAGELKACGRANVEFIELAVAFDAICVVVSAENTWADSMTVEQLRRLWSPEAEGEVLRWDQIQPDWPAEPIRLYSPGRDSGTYDYFTEAIIGSEGVSRSDVVMSEDDDVLVEAVAADEYALAFFGLSYYLRNTDRLKALAVDDGDDANGRGPQRPTPNSVVRGVYQPLSRPLLLYVSNATPRAEVEAFVEFYLCHAARLAADAGAIPLPAELYSRELERFDGRRLGSAFGGAGARPATTIDDLYDMSLEDLMDIEIDGESLGL